MSRFTSRRTAIALLVVAGLFGIFSTAAAGSGVAVLAAATVPALFAVPPRARVWLGMAVALIGAGAGLLGDLAGDIWAWWAIVVLVAAGLIIAVGGRTWPALSGRYGSSTGGGRGPSDDPTELWRELDRGHDPTVAPRRDTSEHKTLPEDPTVD